MNLVIPEKLVRDSKLTRMERDVLAILLVSPEPCIEENSWFAKKVNLTIQGSSRIIQSLKKKGYINTDIKIEHKDKYTKIRTINVLKHKELRFKEEV